MLPESNAALIGLYVSLISVPALFVYLLIREVKDNSPREGLRSPKNAIPIGVFLLFLSWISLDSRFSFDPFEVLFSPYFILGLGFMCVGAIALYKNHKYKKP